VDLIFLCICTRRRFQHTPNRPKVSDWDPLGLVIRGQIRNKTPERYLAIRHAACAYM